MKDVILIITNSINNRLINNSDILGLKEYDIIKATSLKEGMKFLIEVDRINLIILNYSFDDGKASTIFQFLKQHNLFIPTIVILEEIESYYTTQALVDGACSVFIQPISEAYLLLTTMNLIKLTKSQAYLRASESVIEALSKSLEYKDVLTKGHAKRTAELSVKLYDELGLRDLDTRYKLHIGCLLHDIGKVGVPDDVLKSNKIYSHDSEEFKILMQHPKMGFDISLNIKDEIVLDVILNHHEKLDGSGYPRGLKAKDISTEVRIVTIIDIYDSLVHKRSYREKMSIEDALDILEQETKINKISSDIFKAFKNMILTQS